MRGAHIGAAVAALALTAASAQATPVAFTKLTGLTGGSPAATGVYEGILTGNGMIQSITIQDNSFGLGGAAGQFSGFDLDAIVLSYTDISDASQVGTLVPLAVFDFGSATGTIFSPGAQRLPVDPKLFGTDATGTHVDNTVATLGSFDANSATTIPPAFGFVSMGDGGTITFNLTSPVDSTNLHIYIGEVGDNGEVAAGSIFVSQDRVDPNAVPEPATLTLLGTGLLAAARARRRK